MHITNDTLINTAAMTSSINVNAVLDAWDKGCVELYQAIGEWATVVTEEEQHLSNAINLREEGWPGVFAYEVSESVGADIGALLLDQRPVSDEWVRSATREYINTYCRGHEATAAAYLQLSHAADK